MERTETGSISVTCVEFEGVSSTAKRFLRVCISCCSSNFNLRFSLASFFFFSLCVMRRTTALEAVEDSLFCDETLFKSEGLAFEGSEDSELDDCDRE